MISGEGTSILYLYLLCFFFFQAEDGIRDLTVTGVQTCALPIWRIPVAGRARRTARAPLRGDRGRRRLRRPRRLPLPGVARSRRRDRLRLEIGRASCRERG